MSLVTFFAYLLSRHSCFLRDRRRAALFLSRTNETRSKAHTSLGKPLVFHLIYTPPKRTTYPIPIPEPGKLQRVSRETMWDGNSHNVDGTAAGMSRKCHHEFGAPHSHPAHTTMSLRTACSPNGRSSIPPSHLLPIPVMGTASPIPNVIEGTASPIHSHSYLIPPLIASH